jgi:mutual gliding-motility protein MglA
VPHINYYDKELCFKLVYYGPGMGGKTTNLARIHENLKAQARSDLVCLNTTGERTLFFDFLPLELGTVQGFALRFNLYTVPGQIRYEASRKLILDGSDGVIFVADSQPEMLERDLASFEAMLSNIADYGKTLDSFPLVVQYNKRDCPSPLRSGFLRNEFKLPEAVPEFDAIAINGVGVMETLREASRLIVRSFIV